MSRRTLKLPGVSLSRLTVLLRDPSLSPLLGEKTLDIGLDWKNPMYLQYSHRYTDASHSVNLVCRLPVFEGVKNRRLELSFLLADGLCAFTPRRDLLQIESKQS